jgi:hypothetical protein
MSLILDHRMPHSWMSIVRNLKVMKIVLRCCMNSGITVLYLCAGVSNYWARTVYTIHCYWKANRTQWWLRPGPARWMMHDQVTTDTAQIRHAKLYSDQEFSHHYENTLSWFWRFQSYFDIPKLPFKRYIFQLVPQSQHIWQGTTYKTKFVCTYSKGREIKGWCDQISSNQVPNVTEYQVWLSAMFDRVPCLTEC